MFDHFGTLCIKGLILSSILLHFRQKIIDFVMMSGAIEVLQNAGEY